MTKRFRLRVVAQTGTGMQTVGDLLSRALRAVGYGVVSDREFPSLIVGANTGHSCITINFSDEDIFGLDDQVDLLVAIDKQSMKPYISRLKPEGIFVHGYDRVAGIRDILDELEQKKTTIISDSIRRIVSENGGSGRQFNVVLTGMIWGVLGFDLKILEQQVVHALGKKPKSLPINKACLEAGYNAVSSQKIDLPKPNPDKFSRKWLLDGNHALALGAIASGVKAYFAYPMSPASSILSHLANYADKSGMLVKQAEDEITAANLTLGAAHTGVRSLCATSGGGFDLMTETVSLAGMIETPLVLVIAQRPGPATGLPTWTAQADLWLAVHGGHGEYARMVMAVSDVETCFREMDAAQAWAEKFQIPVIVLTERLIADTVQSTDELSAPKTIERSLVTDPSALKKLKSTDRYALTDSGVSPRWLPGSDGPHYFANGDEHGPDGKINEETPLSEDMLRKRLRKLESLRAELPQPEIIGPEKADVSVVGWGSTKNVMRDVIARAKHEGKSINYLHFTYLWPLCTDKLEAFLANNSKVILMEGNATGQLGQLIEQTLKREVFAKKILKADGRGWWLDEVWEALGKES